MIRKYVLYFTLLFPVLIIAQGKNPDHNKDSLQPGTSTSVPFVIENGTSGSVIYEIRVAASDPFIQPILKNGELKINAYEKSIYPVPIKIAAEAPQGKYNVTLYGTEKNTGEKWVKNFEFTVSGSRKISVSMLNSPEYVKAGETINASFLLKNNGNVSENVILESTNAAVIEGTPLTLLPGEERIITIQKKTNPDLGKNEYQNLSLSVYSEDNIKQKQTTYTSVRIISVQPAEDDIFHRLPVTASASFIGMRNRGEYNNGFQGEIYGKGSLDKNNEHLLEFRAVTKNPVEFNSFTQYEEYFINYKKDHFFIHLGDKNYSSSFLTEYARYGRGAEIRFDMKNVSLGGFYNHPRFFRDIKDEFNIYSKFRLAGASEITAGYLYKVPRRENLGLRFSGFRLNSDAHLPYLAGKFKLNSHLEVSGEASYSKTHNTDGTAFMFQAATAFEKINGNIMYTRSSPEYAGYFNNTSTFNGNLQYRLSKKINVLANYVQDARNFQRDTLLLAAPYRKFLQYGVQYRYLKSGSVMLHSGFQRYEDRLMPKEFDYKERFFKISIDQQIGIFQLNMEGQFGKTDNYLSGFSGNSGFYTMNIGFEKFKTSFNLYGSYANTSRYQMQEQKQFYYGARIFSRFSDRMSFSIFYQNNYIPEDYYADRNLFEILFRRRLFPGHEIDISGRYALQRGELNHKDFIFSLRYAVHFNVPMQKTADYTALSGTVRNLGVKKIEGIRLILGNHLSVTDKNGNYTFKNIIPGNYILEIDRSTTDMNDIPDVNFPASLMLAGKENIFNFGLLSAGQIQGNIHYSESENASAFTGIPLKKENKKNKKLILETSNGDQTYRKIVGIGEKYDFTYLRPGIWNVKVYRNGLEKRYKIPVDSFQFILKSSETRDLIIHVVKQASEIKYQKEIIKVMYNKK